MELGSGAIRRLVINLSLNIMPDIRRLPYVWFDHRQLPSTQLAGAMRVLAHIEEGLRLLFESLYAHDVLIVAAAGNDSFLSKKQGQKPRPPRIPARYDTTVSVASVNSRSYGLSAPSESIFITDSSFPTGANSYPGRFTRIPMLTQKSGLRRKRT